MARLIRVAASKDGTRKAHYRRVEGSNISQHPKAGSEYEKRVVEKTGTPKSGWIDEISYHPDKKELTVNFKTGAIWKYSDVSKKKYSMFKKNHGYLHKIKLVHKAKRIL